MSGGIERDSTRSPTSFWIRYSFIAEGMRSSLLLDELFLMAEKHGVQLDHLRSEAVVSLYLHDIGELPSCMHMVADMGGSPAFGHRRIGVEAVALHHVVKAWNGKYSLIQKPWESHWDDLSEFFAYPDLHIHVVAAYG